MRKATILTISGLLVIILAATSTMPTTAQGTALNTFWVFPSGDVSGETDWSNIMATFNQAVVSGSGSTLKFAEGDFYVHRPIQVANFSGTVMGAGKDLTRLHTAPGRLFSLQDYPLTPLPSYMAFYLNADWPKNIIADITVSDLSFYIDGPSESWGSHNPTFQLNNMNVVDVHGIVRGYNSPDHANHEITHINVTFRHLKAVADTGSEYLQFGSSILNNYQAMGEFVIHYDYETNTTFFRWSKPITGTYIFEDIEMYDSAWSLAVVNARDSDIRIGGSEPNKVIARGTIDSVELINISNSIVEVSYLDASNVEGGISLLQGLWAAWGNDLGELVPETLPEPSSFVFHHNHIVSEAGWYSAFELANPGGELGQPIGDVTISNNTIDIKNHEPPFEGIFSYFIDNLQVTNNKILGRGWAGIWVEPFGTPSTGCMIQGNNLNGYDAELAPIYLGPGTNGCTVIGGNNLDNVVDEGTDNILTGVNNMGSGIGLDISLFRRKKP